MAETINGLYKAEMIHRRAPWKAKESVGLAILEWVSWFNRYRLLEPIGYIPPAEAGENYFRQLPEQVAIVASLHGTRGDSFKVQPDIKIIFIAVFKGFINKDAY